MEEIGFCRTGKEEDGFGLNGMAHTATRAAFSVTQISMNFDVTSHGPLNYKDKGLR
jgi:hypothetical protein